MLFRARQFEFEFSRPALIMGVVNVTPDSFSDGGQFADSEKAVARALDLAEQGAAIVDIGGESTRPGAEPVSEVEELRRVIPVIEQLAQRLTTPISIDTVKPAVARAAIAAGASIVNDTAGSRDEDSMWRLVAETEAGYICMHIQGNPKTMQTAPHYADVTKEVAEFFGERLSRLAASGITRERVALDPGIGFGKTAEHNLQLLANLGIFRKFERPIVLGASRKSFIGKVVPADISARLPGSLACACLAVEAGVQVIRTHDVIETVQAVRLTEAVLEQRSK